MPASKIREQLTIKPVGIKHLNQFNELLRYVYQVTSQELEQSGYTTEGELVKAKRPVLQQADVIGWFNDEQLVSQLCIYPSQVNIHGKIFDMGGVTGVGTYPEYAGLGLMSDLIKVGLKHMREKKQWISYLYPYSVPFYRKKGWEIATELITFDIKDYQLPKYGNVNGQVERLAVDHEDVLDTYDRFSRAHHGTMIRGTMEWEEYWRWEDEDERTAAVYYDSSGIAMGYVMYWIEGDVFHIKEMIYLNQEAYRGLWNFISAHHSMIDAVKGSIFKNEPLAFLLDDSQIKETVEPYFMARIVDVEAFLKSYPFVCPAKPFHFVVSDPSADWNNGIFGLSWSNKGELTVSREAVGKPVTLSIQTLTAMLMSYRRPSYFYRIERLHADIKTLRILEDIISDEQPYFSDYF